MAKTGPNKSKEWRKQTRIFDPAKGYKVRVGRMYKNIRQQMGVGKAYPTELVVLLMKHAGIQTPVFDANLEAMRIKGKELVEQKNSEVVDAEVVTQGA